MQAALDNGLPHSCPRTCPPCLRMDAGGNLRVAVKNTLTQYILFTSKCAHALQQEKIIFVEPTKSASVLIRLIPLLMVVTLSIQNECINPKVTSLIVTFNHIAFTSQFLD